MTPLAPGTRFGGFAIERPLSAGGMGVVYVAKHVDTGRAVALKVIKSDAAAADPELVARFRKETGALAAVSHPNVVTFLDSGVDDASGTFFLVMELLAGRPLRSIMSGGASEDGRSGPASSRPPPAGKNGPVPWQRALRIAADVCRALSAVHAQGIIHRDLKPENVFLVDAIGHDEIAKLIDFGIARLESASSTRATATRTGAVVGTPGYISPEQLRGEPATQASDVYAVGVILYELVTGRFPFEAPNTHAMLVKQLVEPLPPPRTVLSSLPAHVESLIMHFMEREPSRRVANATDALALLTGARDEPAQPALALAPDALTEAGTRVASLSQAIVSSSTPPAPPAPLTTPTAAAPTAATPLRALDAPIAPLVVPAKKSSLPVAVAIVVMLGFVAIAFVIVVAVIAINTQKNHAAFAEGGRGGAGGGGGDVVGKVRGAGKLAGIYNAVYVGTFDAIGLPRQSNNGTATVTVGDGGANDVAMTFVNDATHATCQVTFDRRGDVAFFAPLQQSCSFVNADGSRQTNTHAGKGTFRGNEIVVDVDGTFVGATAVNAPFAGSFRGRWTLHRR